MDNAELLAQLHDIHMPAAVSLWPLSLGWWLLAVTLLLLAALGMYQGIVRMHRQRRLQRVLAELASLRHRYAEQAATNEAALRYVNEVNSLLRRVALFHYPNSGVGTLSGEAWVDFIRQKGSGPGISGALDKDLAWVLGFGRFQRSCQVDSDALYRLAESWIRGLYHGRAA